MHAFDTSPIVVAPARRASWRHLSLGAREIRRGFAISAALVGLVAVDLTATVLPGGGAFVLLLLPVAVGSALAGRTSGLVALVLGAAGAVLLVVLRGHPWLQDPADAARLAAFLGVGLVIVALAPREADGPAGRSPSRSTLPADAGPVRMVEPLTPREQEVLVLAAGGLTVASMSRRLRVSPNTVKSHLGHAYGKLGAHNRAEAIAAGHRAGYLQLPEPAAHGWLPVDGGDRTAQDAGPDPRREALVAPMPDARGRRIPVTR